MQENGIYKVKVVTSYDEDLTEDKVYMVYSEGISDHVYNDARKKLDFDEFSSKCQWVRAD